MPAPSSDVSPPETSEKLLQKPADEPAQRIGRFVLRGELGRGGMATVHRAFDPTLSREVALKVMLPGFGGRTDLAARFQREARALAATRDDAIVAAYEFVPAQGNEPACLVGELIEGPSLRAILDAQGGKVWPEIAVILGLRVAQALAVAHAAGIVHRDVKPDNVLVDLRAGPRARAVLSDFGVARILGAESNTTTGALLGSPAYMSPEQARGADDVGPRSDVFSLGVMLYQLVTGALPFPGKEPVVVISNILRGELTRPGRLCARLSPELEQIIMRCLRPDPAERFADGGAVRAALEPLRAKLPFVDKDMDMDVAKALGSYLADARAFEQRYAKTLGKLAAEEAERAAKSGDRPRMLSHLNRALEYDPQQGLATRLLAQVGRARDRQRWVMRGGAVAAVLLAAGGALWAVKRARLSAAAEASPTGAAESPTRAAALALPLMAPASGPPIAKPVDTASAANSATAPPAADPARAPAGDRTTTSATSLPPGTPAGSSASSGNVADPPRARRNRLVSLRGDKGAPAVVKRSGETEGSPQGVALPAPTAQTSSPSPALVPPPAAPAHESEGALAEPAPAPSPVAPPRAGLTVRAAHAFCAPSVDDGPASLRAAYDALAPGSHAIYCTPPGKPKVLVGRYELRDGAHPNLIIVPDDHGQPLLARPK